MKTKFILALFLFSALGIGLGYGISYFFSLEESTPTQADLEPTAPLSITAAGETFETTVTTDGIGEILVQVTLPASPRYSEGAPIVVVVPTFFTPQMSGFRALTGLSGLTEEGIISVTMMYPGRSDGDGKVSAGTDDFGGPDSVKALRDVLLFAMGEKNNSDGYSLKQLSAVEPLYGNVGIYAFSHPGIAATAVLGTYPDELGNIAYFVGRENPTLDLLSSLELGHWETEGKSRIANPNPLYQYPRDYSSTSINLDYSSVNYDQNSQLPYFDTNGNNQLDPGEFSLGTQVPSMFGKRYYSRALLHALEDNGALTASSWPADLATPEEADSTWETRESVPYYSTLNKGLHVMLIFAEESHVQVSEDQPSIHQAYDGFESAGVWVRLNPDSSYVTELEAKGANSYTENDANTEPSNWANLSGWAYPTGAYSAIVPIAGILEMADRTYSENWSNNLNKVLK